MYKISIITVCYNSKKYIKYAIESVLTQTYPNIEYIIIDGKSKDETISIIKSYEPSFVRKMRWISEPDGGIYDAMNKGIQMATGDIIGILNSDDFYISKNALKEVVQCFEDNEVDSVYAQLYCVLPNDINKIVRNCTYKNCKKIDFFFGWHPPHPAFFVKKSVYDKLGLFDTSFKIASDYDIMLRFFLRGNISTIYLRKYIMKMRMGGISQNRNTIIMKMKEEVRVLKRYFSFLFFIPFLSKSIRKLYQLKV